jgi:O-antigen/teichoic acid export membrane protein
VSKQKDLVKNTLILAFGKMSTQFISFLLLPLYTVFLSPGEFGTVDLIITYITLLVPAITIQLEMASFRFLVDARDNEVEKKRIISNILWLVGLIVIVCVPVFLLINAYVPIPYVGLVLLNIIVTIFSGLFLQFARGVGKNKQFAIGSIIAGVVMLVGAVVLIAILRMGAEGLLFSIAIANASCALYLFAALKTHKYIGFGLRDRKLQNQLMKYSFPLVPNGISWWVINVSDRTIIAVFLSVAANGIYAVANKFSILFMGVFSVFGMAWTESASMHINAKDRDKFFSDTMNASVRLFGSLGLLLIAIIPLIFTFLIDTKFHEAYLYIPILVVAAFFNVLVSLYGTIYIAKKLTKQVANTSMLAAGINMVINFALIHFIGLYAAAISTVIAYLAMSVYRHYDAKKYVTITYEKHIFVKLTLLYTVVLLLYYYNTMVGNIMSAVFAATIAILLNKSIVRVMKNKVLSLKNRKKLTAEQEEYENLL